MTTTFLGSVTRLGVLLDEDVMVYVDQPNSAVQVPVGSAAEVTLTERDVMVADRDRSAGCGGGDAHWRRSHHDRAPELGFSTKTETCSSMGSGRCQII